MKLNIVPTVTATAIFADVSPKAVTNSGRLSANVLVIPPCANMINAQPTAVKRAFFLDLFIVYPPILSRDGLDHSEIMSFKIDL